MCDDLGPLPEIEELFPCVGEAGAATVLEIEKIVAHMTTCVGMIRREGPTARPSPEMLKALKAATNTYLELSGFPQRIG